MGFLVLLVIGLVVGNEMNKEPVPEPVVVVPPPVVSEEPVYTPNRYYRNKNGYLVTDLSVPRSGDVDAQKIVRVLDVPSDMPLDQVDFNK